MSQPEFDLDEIVDETIRCISVRPEGDAWVGESPGWFGPLQFGGFVVGQAVHDATRSAPEGQRIHSLHGYFLRPMRAGLPSRYEIEPVRDGRSFATRRLLTIQEDKPVFTMHCSFTADTDGYEYGRPLSAEIPAPESLERELGPGPWEAAYLGPTEPDVDGVRASTNRQWARIAKRLPDDPHLHDALVAFLTDMTGPGARPLLLTHDISGIISLDHAVWFHRRVRADEWLFYDVASVVNTGGRGLLHGSIYGADGDLAVSVSQETLLRPPD